jgi:cytochrome P450
VIATRQARYWLVASIVIVVRDFDIDGYRIPAGTPLTISVPSALRDPSVYADPDRFDIFRKDHPRWHPIFGAGAHRCVCEALARVEMEESARDNCTAGPRLAA